MPYLYLDLAEFIQILVNYKTQERKGNFFDHRKNIKCHVTLLFPGAFFNCDYYALQVPALVFCSASSLLSASTRQGPNKLPDLSPQSYVKNLQHAK